jgi:hypothetical protein
MAASNTLDLELLLNFSYPVMAARVLTTRPMSAEIQQRECVGQNSGPVKLGGYIVRGYFGNMTDPSTRTTSRKKNTDPPPLPPNTKHAHTVIKELYL